MNIEEISWFLNISQDKIRSLPQTLQEALENARNFIEVHMLGYSVFAHLNQKEAH